MENVRDSIIALGEELLIESQKRKDKEDDKCIEKIMTYLNNHKEDLIEGETLTLDMKFIPYTVIDFIEKKTAFTFGDMPGRYRIRLKECEETEN